MRETKRERCNETQSIKMKQDDNSTTSTTAPCSSSSSSATIAELLFQHLRKQQQQSHSHIGTENNTVKRGTTETNETNETNEANEDKQQQQQEKNNILVADDFFLHPALQLQTHPQHGIGLIVTETIPTQTILIQLPKNLHIRVDNIHHIITEKNSNDTRTISELLLKEGK